MCPSEFILISGDQTLNWTCEEYCHLVFDNRRLSNMDMNFPLLQLLARPFSQVSYALIAKCTSRLLSRSFDVLRARFEKIQLISPQRVMSVELPST